MRRVLVTGASGNIGGEVVTQLRAAGLPVRALSRNPPSSNLPVGTDVVRGDLTAPDTLDPALDDVAAVLLVWVAPLAAAADAIARIASRVDRIVFVSAPIQFGRRSTGQLYVESLRSERHSCGGGADRWPPMGRLDRACDPDDPAHIRDAAMRKLTDTGFGFVPPGDLRSMNPNDVPASGPCSRGGTSFREKLRAASVASGDGDDVYPQTMVWFVFEGMDSAGAAALGTTYYDLLIKSGSPLVNKTVVPGVDHGGLVRSRSGAEAIRDVLLNECRSRKR